eukprot:294183_1
MKPVEIDYIEVIEGTTTQIAEQINHDQRPILLADRKLAFYREINNPLRHSCGCGCSLHTGIQIWTLLITIGYIYNIYIFVLYLFPKPLSHGLLDVWYFSIITIHQNPLYIGYVMFYLFGIVCNFSAVLIGLQCLWPIFILLPIIFIFLASISDLIWLVITIDNIYVSLGEMSGILIRVWPVVLYITAYRLANYYKNASFNQPNSNKSIQ